MNKLTTDQYIELRSYILHQCRGYWDGTTCANKHHFQRALVGLRAMRKELNDG